MDERIPVQVLAPGSMRAMLEFLLARQPGLRVVNERASVFFLYGEEAWLARSRRIHLLPREPGAGLVMAAARGYPDLVTGSRLGIRAFVAPTDPPEEIVEAIRCAHQRQAFCSRSVQSVLLEAASRSLRPDSEAPDPLLAARLTRREQEVAMLAARLLPNREIARQLSTSVNTVKSLLQRVFRKLGVHNKADLLTRLYPPGDGAASAEPLAGRT